MIEYRADDRTFRGDPEAISELRDRLAAQPPNALAEELGAAGVSPTDPDAGTILEAAHAALRAPLIDVELTVAGPGALHHHEIAVGINAVGVRRSPVREGVAELGIFPFTQLPGGLARLMRFLPGRDTAPGVPPVHVPADVLLSLAAAGADERTRAFGDVTAQIEAAGLSDPEDPSWQVVQIAAHWLTPEGEETERIALHLRSGAQYFLIAEGPDGFFLHPVPSIRAWEHTMGALPGSHEVGRRA